MFANDPALVLEVAGQEVFVADRTPFRGLPFRVVLAFLDKVRPSGQVLWVGEIEPGKSGDRLFIGLMDIILLNGQSGLTLGRDNREFSG